MKSSVLLMLLFFAIACNNSGEAHHAADSTNVQTGGADNVNGNIPDTTSGLKLNQPLPVDSSTAKDSTRK